MTARQHLRRLIVLIVVLVVGLTVLGSVALLLLFRQVDALDAKIPPAEAANGQVLQSMTDAETGLRGFVITKDPTFLQPFDSGLSKLNIAQLQIEASLADQPSLLALARAEHRSAEAWLHDFARPLGAQRPAPPTVGLAAASGLIDPEHGDRGQFLRKDRVGHRYHRPVAGVPGRAPGGGHLGDRPPAVQDCRGHLRLRADGEPGPRWDLRDRLGELLPGAGRVAAQPLLFAPQQVGKVRADLHILRPGHHPALGSGGDDLAQRTPADPRRRG